jgi:hypothetical protein
MTRHPHNLHAGTMREHALGKLTPVHGGHAHIGEEQIKVGGCLAGQCERFEWIGGPKDDIPCQLEDVLYHPTDI